MRISAPLSISPTFLVIGFTARRVLCVVQALECRIVGGSAGSAMRGGQCHLPPRAADFGNQEFRGAIPAWRRGLHRARVAAQRWESGTVRISTLATQIHPKKPVQKSARCRFDSRSHLMCGGWMTPARDARCAHVRRNGAARSCTRTISLPSLCTALCATLIQAMCSMPRCDLLT